MFYVLTHKGCDPYFLQFKPNHVLHVGLGPSDSPDYLFDSTGDSISEKNPYFCELTGIYWIWKNGEEKPDDLVGIEQYRRIFLLHEHAFLDSGNAEKLLEKYDMILPERLMLTESVRQQYGIWHRKEDLDLLERVFTEMYPDMKDAFQAVMDRSWLHPYNMMICKRKMFDAYCSWVFPLLFELEKRIDVLQMEDPYQQRVFGFLAERLVNVWVLAAGLKCKELIVLKTGL